MVHITVCGECKHCKPTSAGGCDCRCEARSEEGITHEVSRDDDTRYYGDYGEPCEFFRMSR